MKDLLQIEWIKMRSYRTFWIMLGLHVLALLLMAVSMQTFVQKIMSSINSKTGTTLYFPILEFPDVWIHFTWLAVFVRFFLGVLVITMLTNEFTYKTARQNVIDGWSREDFLKAKILQTFILAFISMTFIFVIGFVFALLNNPSQMNRMFENIHYLGLYFLQVLVYLQFCLLLALVVRRSGLAIICLIAYSFVELQWIGRLIDVKNIDDFIYFPFNTPMSVMKPPFTKYFPMGRLQDIELLSLLPALGYMALFGLGFYTYFKKKDL